MFSFFVLFYVVLECEVDGLMGRWNVLWCFLSWRGMGQYADAGYAAKRCVGWAEWQVELQLDLFQVSDVNVSNTAEQSRASCPCPCPCLRPMSNIHRAVFSSQSQRHLQSPTGLRGAPHSPVCCLLPKWSLWLLSSSRPLSIRANMIQVRVFGRLEKTSAWRHY